MLPKIRVQTKIFANLDPDNTQDAANNFLKTVVPEMIGEITHETKVDEKRRLIYIIKVNYRETVLA